jgi:hypothetical protein
MLLLHAVEDSVVESCSILVLNLIAAQRVDSHLNAIHEFNGRAFAFFGSMLVPFTLVAFLDLPLLRMVLDGVTAGEVEMVATEPASDPEKP